LEWKGLGDSVQKKKPSREDLEAFETAYNAACGSIAREELIQALVLLKRAKGWWSTGKNSGHHPDVWVDLCQASDELTEEDKAAELLPIMVQQLYVLLRLGKSEEAEKLALGIPVIK
jgi:signal recognition particle subunit SRP72